MLENEEDLFKKWAVNNGLCKSSFNFKKFGFVSWKHYVQQKYYDQTHAREIWNEFRRALPANDCHVILYNMPMKERSKDVLLLILWSPKGASYLRRVIIPSSKQKLSLLLVGKTVDITGSADALSFDKVWEKLQKDLAQ